MSEISQGQWRTALPVRNLKNGKKKMVTIGKKMILVGMHEDNYFATEALCRHMRWPLAWGAKVSDDCIRCPLHQTTHKIDDGELVEWSPFPLFPPYGRIVGKMSKQKDLTVYDTRIKDSNIEVFF